MTFEIKPTARGVVTTQTIDWTLSGIPRPVLWIIGFISRFGRARGPGPLDHLKRLVESSRRAAA